ncbi:MAG: hypothetical protein ACT4R6_04195, partial [Gemmatimonadaceae bacterium]
MMITVRAGLVFAVLGALSVAAPAQRSGMAASPLGFVTGPYTFDLSDGEPISWFLEHSQALKLTSDQKTALMTIRRRLRDENERFMERLDSTAQIVGLTLGERRRMTGAEREALERFNTITQPTRDSMRVNNDIARAEALALLNKQQQTRLDSLVAGLRRDRGSSPSRRGENEGASLRRGGAER